MFMLIINVLGQLISNAGLADEFVKFLVIPADQIFSFVMELLGAM